MAGDIVYVKPGVYNEGMKFSSFVQYMNMTNRVLITKEVDLEATGNKADTIIEGYISEQDGSNGCGTDEKPYNTLQKAVNMATNDWTLIHARRGEYNSGGNMVSNLYSRVDFTQNPAFRVLLRTEYGPTSGIICLISVTTFCTIYRWIHASMRRMFRSACGYRKTKEEMK